MIRSLAGHPVDVLRRADEVIEWDADQDGGYRGVDPALQSLTPISVSLVSSLAIGQSMDGHIISGSFHSKKTQVYSH